MGKTVLIIGGGITGLSAAYYLQKMNREKKLDYSIILAEKSDRLGGKIQTIKRDDFILETGPDSMLKRKAAITDLTLDLGIENDLVGTNPKASAAAILHKGKLHPIPPGFVYGIPTEWKSFIKTSIISTRGKLRAALDLVLPDRSSFHDESLGGFFERRLGRELTETVIEPLISGIYAGDTRQLGLMATFPDFRKMEQQSGSLIKGMLFTKTKKQSAPQPGNTYHLPKTVQRSMFIAYKQGLSTLINAIEQSLEVDIRKGCGVNKIVKDLSGYKVYYGNGAEEYVDAVIVTSPFFIAKKILSDFGAMEKINVPYVSVANVILAYNKQDVSNINSTGFVVPRKEGRRITACTFTSSKWLHTSPEDKVLLRCYVGHASDQSWVNSTDETLISEVREELKELLSLDANPSMVQVTRWDNAMPQYTVGHLDRINRLRERLRDEAPGILLAGAAMEGVGIPDCIKQGKQAAEQIVNYM